VRDRETIGKLVKAVGGPLNVLLQPGCPALGELEKLGVARASAGSAVMRATLGLAQRIAKELKERGTYESLFSGAMPYADVNRMLARKTF
jgi:2-methylisocitrate lyase-like PEP mutase family enzyme